MHTRPLAMDFMRPSPPANRRSTPRSPGRRLRGLALRTLAVGIAAAVLPLAGPLLDEGLRKIDLFTARHKLAVAEWPVVPFDPFFNANAPDDLTQAEAIARTGAG